MRDSLSKLISETIVHRYDLPYEKAGISKTIYSLENDRCFSSNDHSNFADIIYNSVVEYAFNEFDIADMDYNDLHSAALRTKLKWNEAAEEKEKLKYGFYGEVVFFAILYSMYHAKPLIARGYFYNPLENAETKGYDSYHLVENDNDVQLWFWRS